MEFVHSYCFSSVQPAKLDWEVCADEFMKLVMYFVPLNNIREFDANLTILSPSVAVVQMIKLRLKGSTGQNAQLG